MSKKFFISLSIAILAGIGIWYFITQLRVETLPPVITPSPEIPKEAVASVGWSTAEDEEAAAEEAAVMMLGKLKKDPDFAFVSLAPTYEPKKLLSYLRQHLPKTKILGRITFMGVVTPGGYFADQPHSMAILGVATPEITWGISAVQSTNEILSREAAKQAVLEAIEDAGKEATEKPDLILSIPGFYEGEEALLGISDAVGNDVPVFGAHSVDNEVNPTKWGVFANDKIYSQGVAVGVVYTDLKISYGGESRYEVTEKGGVVTKVVRPVLVNQIKIPIIAEIDGRPAADVYNEWLGGAIDEMLKDPEKATLAEVLKIGGANPFGKIVRVPGEEPVYITVGVMGVNPDRSLTIKPSIEEGDEIRLLRGDWEILLDRLRTTPEKIMDKFEIAKEDILFAIGTGFCCSSLIVPTAEWKRGPQLVRGAIGDTPWLIDLPGGNQIFDPRLGRNVDSEFGYIMLIFSR